MIFWLRDFFTLKNASRHGEVSLKNRNSFDYGTFGDRALAYTSAKVQSRFYPGDLYPRDFWIIRESWHVCNIRLETPTALLSLRTAREIFSWQSHGAAVTKLCPR